MDNKELIKIMKRTGIDSAELSRTLGISRQAVNHWIVGRRSIPEIVARLMRLFDSDPTIKDEYKSFASEKPASVARHSPL